MKKITGLILVVFLSFSFSILDKVKAFEYNGNYYEPLEIQDLENFKSVLKTRENKTYEGKYYRVGIMGHKRVVELGSLDSIQYIQLTEGEQFTSGIVKEIKTIETKSFKIDKTVSSEERVKVGFTNIMAAAINFFDFLKVGSENSYTVEREFVYKEAYTSTNVEETTTELQYNLENLIPDCSLFSVGQVALVAVWNVKSSYTIEQRGIGGFKKWYKLKNTETKNYTIDYYADSFTTFIYPTGFGDAEIGFYSFGIINI